MRKHQTFSLKVELRINVANCIYALAALIWVLT